MKNKKVLEQQKRLMGIIEDSYFTTSAQTPVTLIQKIQEMKSHAENVSHFSEMATRSFRKISSKLKEFENKALESPDILNAESKSLMNQVRMALEEIDKAQERGNTLLKSIDFLLAGSSWPQDNKI